MTKYQQTPEEIAGHFRDSIEILKDAADGFDNGKLHQSKTMAQVMRVLFRGQPDAPPLVRQAGFETHLLIDTAMPRDELLPNYHALAAVGTNSGTHEAFLDWPHGPSVPISQTDWLNAVVLDDGTGNRLTRMDLINRVSNKEGLGHVSPEIPASYAAFSRKNALGVTISRDGESRIDVSSPERAAIRQMAHEVIKSFELGYTRKAKISGAAIGPIFFTPIDKVTNHPVTMPEQVISENLKGSKLVFTKMPNGEYRISAPGKIGRNEPCPCLSGKKFKNCHLAQLQTQH
ncbi:hypothetical protein GT347_16020 [Xylophilus rhododendri]|uniref:SEC-C motif-containing protein n=1 Tax=Xylophilus rhododendri TaxID=2697032 RepID=A0A857J8F7_9BURK|nr:SEC-C metal-binding domain-containing protein [Xylophilus rhododendri]QHI99351.1 hypothetical protein GT347_16020 [Xylophilus rhododendri]